jgi:crotonobetainyl-CoA:carnitine CoA-transferase CaiB-like acyl-CoA transferase
MGVASYPGVAMHLPKSPGVAGRPALLGEHNEYVFNELLGLSKEEISQLVEAEVLV